MPEQTKLAEAEMKKLAEVEAFDREQAIELGFAKAAMELGLDEQSFREFYQLGCQRVQEQAKA